MEDKHECKACHIFYHEDDISIMSFSICKKCYDKADKENPDLDHWDLWELTRNK